MKVICQNPACGLEFKKPPHRLCKHGDFCSSDCRRTFRMNENARKRDESRKVPDGYVTVRTACDTLGISREAVRARCARRSDCILQVGNRVFVDMAKLSEPTENKRGPTPPAPTDEQILLLISEYQNGDTLRMIARKHHLSEAVVRQCLINSGIAVAKGGIYWSQSRFNRARNIFRLLTSDERCQLIKEFQNA